MNRQLKKDLLNILESVYQKIEEIPLRGASQDIGVAAKSNLRTAYKIAEGIIEEDEEKTEVENGR